MSNPAVPFATGAADGSTPHPAAGLVLPIPPPGFEFVELSAARRWLPVAILLVVGTACLIAVVPLYRQGIAGHAFPSYVNGDPTYEVQRYTAPWIAGALALGGLGIILWLVAIARVVTTRGIMLGQPQFGERVGTPAATSAVMPSERSAPSEPLLPRPSEAAREY